MDEQGGADKLDESYADILAGLDNEALKLVIQLKKERDAARRRLSKLRQVLDKEDGDLEEKISRLRLKNLSLREEKKTAEGKLETARGLILEAEVVLSQYETTREMAAFVPLLDRMRRFVR